MDRFVFRLFLIAFLIGFTFPAMAGGGASAEAIKAFLAKAPESVEDVDIDAGELNRFYEARQYEPAWDTGTKESAEVLKKFQDSVKAFTDYHGLSASVIPSALIDKLKISENEADALKLEIVVTHSFLHLAHALRGDAIKLEHLYPGWAFQREPTDLPAGLAKAVGENRIHEYIQSLAPTAPVYARLADALKKYREKEPWSSVESGPKLVKGDKSPRVAQIRARLAAEDYLDESSLPPNEAETFDEALQAVVEAYQQHNGLKADGVIGAQTIVAMNVPLKDRVDQIIANMERARHMPEEEFPRMARVNIADATIVVRDGDSISYQGPVVVGRVDRKTPFIQSKIRSVVFNPIWHVPMKIAQKDILPKLRKDPHYLEKLGFVINGSADDPYGDSIDWNTVRANAFNFELRQSPGDMNSLGRLKFDFDNEFAVYMHGTPHPELFEKAERFLSSGCVRLRDPEQFAVILLAANADDWTLERVQEEIDKGKTRWLRLSSQLPVMFVYETVIPSEVNGRVDFRKDVYDYDRFLVETMRKGE